VNNAQRRIGVLLPPGNVAVEREFARYAPADVACNYNRMSRSASVLTKSALLSMIPSLERASVDLAQVHPEVILFACTSGSFLEGRGKEDEIARRITGYTGIPAITTSVAVTQALDALGIRRAFMITPYPDDINAEEVAFLAHYGIEVPQYDAFRCDVTEHTAAIPSGSTHDGAPPSRPHRRMRRAFRKLHPAPHDGPDRTARARARRARRDVESGDALGGITFPRYRRADPGGAALCHESRKRNRVKLRARRRRKDSGKRHLRASGPGKQTGTSRMAAERASRFQWIHVADALPEPFETVVLWVVGGPSHSGKDYAALGVYNARENVFEVSHRDSEEPVAVTHWLPVVPKQ